MSAAVNVADLSPEQHRDLGLRLPRQTDFTKEDLRAWSLKVLAAMANLSRQERARVLKHAPKVNAI